MNFSITCVCLNRLWAVLRIAMGWIFFWAFLDKLFGWGFATAAEHAWIAGRSPTEGFLQNAKGPLAPLLQAMAGSAAVDWLFMIGLFGIGLALLLGIGMRIAAYSGTVLTILMTLATWPPVHNPLIDEHVIYILIFISFLFVPAANYYSLQKYWQKTYWVKRWQWLR